MDVYTSAQAAAALGLHHKTVVRWCRNGTIPGAVLLYGNRRLGWRIPRSAVDGMRESLAVAQFDAFLDQAAPAAAATQRAKRG